MYTLTRIETDIQFKQNKHHLIEFNHDEQGELGNPRTKVLNEALSEKNHQYAYETNMVFMDDTTFVLINYPLQAVAGWFTLIELSKTKVGIDYLYLNSRCKHLDLRVALFRDIVKWILPQGYTDLLVATMKPSPIELALTYADFRSRCTDSENVCIFEMCGEW